MVSNQIIKKTLPFLLVLMTLIQNVKSQEKVIQGDTAFWYRWNKSLAEKLNLMNFSNTQDDFTFRFWNQGQVVEITKNNDSIAGVLTNYIYWSHRRNQKETFSERKFLDNQKVIAAYKIIQNSGILDLQSDNQIENWSHGYDGITYTIEHSDENTYWFKNYWTPSAQDSIPEAVMVMDFVNDFSDTLDLVENYNEFKESLPHKGCYNSGGMAEACYVSNSFELGYYGSTKLLYGYSTSLQLTYIGSVRTNFGISIHHQFDQNSNYDFAFTLGKSNLFFNKTNSVHDFLVYQYRKRELEFPASGNSFDNHQFYYGLSLKNNLNLAFGIDYLLEENKTFGGILYASKWINRPKINILGKTSIFESHVDYQLGISKLFIFNSSFPIGGSSIGFNFERFKAYNDLNLSLTIWI